MNFVGSIIVFVISSLAAAGVTVATFHFFTHNLGPSALGALMFWPAWLLVYFGTGAITLWFLA